MGLKRPLNLNLKEKEFHCLFVPRVNSVTSCISFLPPYVCVGASGPQACVVFLAVCLPPPCCGEE